MLRLLLGLLKTAVVVVVFFIGCCSIVLSQLVGMGISLVLYQRVDSELTHAWIARTKNSFIVLLSSAIIFASKTPITVRITSPNLDKNRLRSYTDGSIETALAPHAVYIGNHQIYTDWMFLWWLAGTADMAGFFYIILKHELSKLPLLGWGMKNYDFIFLTRKWENDKANMGLQLERIDANARGKGPSCGYTIDAKNCWPSGNDPSKSWPYQLMIYPEGTNMSANTRGKSEAYAKKVDKKPFKHVLLPKITGLRFTLLKLRKSVKEVYDLTVGYSGVKADEYGQDIYRLPQVFLYGKNPELVDMHLRVISISEIPLGKLEYDDPEEEAKDKKIFEDWLFEVWQVKDDLMDKYYKTGSFVDENDTVTARATTTLTLKWMELLQTFVVPATFLAIARIVYIIYGIKYNPGSCAASPAAAQPTFLNVFE